MALDMVYVGIYAYVCTHDTVKVFVTINKYKLDRKTVHLFLKFENGIQPRAWSIENPISLISLTKCWQSENFKQWSLFINSSKYLICINAFQSRLVDFFLWIEKYVKDNVHSIAQYWLYSSVNDVCDCIFFLIPTSEIILFPKATWLTSILIYFSWRKILISLLSQWCSICRLIKIIKIIQAA